MTDPMKLKKTEPAKVRHTGSKAEREYRPASYDVYIHGVRVGELDGWSMGRIRGNPYGHEFRVRKPDRIECYGGVGPRGHGRERLREVALQEYSQQVGRDT